MISGIVITIRKSDAANRSELEACFADLQTFERTIEANRAAPDALTHAYVDGLLANCATAQGSIFVAEVDGRIVGFVCVLSRVVSDDVLEEEREYAYVTDLIVLERHRGLGIGGRLMQAAEAHALASGAERMRVGVLAANSLARGLYRNLGYREYEIVLEKQLVPVRQHDEAA